jgi:hypothetical protein
MKIPIENIIVPENRREIDTEKVVQLAESIQCVGLLNPISVTKDHRLVAGVHRLEAVKLQGEKESDVSYIDGDDLHLELAEIDENLVRNELHYIDRADALSRRKAIYETLHPMTKHGKRNGQTPKTAESAVLETSFAADTYTIREDVQLADDLIPDSEITIARNTSRGFKLPVKDVRDNLLMVEEYVFPVSDDDSPPKPFINSEVKPS